LFACLFATGLCKTHRRWRGLRRTRVVARSWPFRGLLQECAMRALVRCRQPRRAAAAQAHCTMCVCVEYPRRRVLCCQRVERPLATRLHVSTRSRTSARP
jgi:hypothetical protein